MYSFLCVVPFSRFLVCWLELCSLQLCRGFKWKSHVRLHWAWHSAQFLWVYRVLYLWNHHRGLSKLNPSFHSYSPEKKKSKPHAILFYSLLLWNLHNSEDWLQTQPWVPQRSSPPPCPGPGAGLGCARAVRPWEVPSLQPLAEAGEPRRGGSVQDHAAYFTEMLVLPAENLTSWSLRIPSRYWALEQNAIWISMEKQQSQVSPSSPSFLLHLCSAAFRLACSVAWDLNRSVFFRVWEEQCDFIIIPLNLWLRLYRLVYYFLAYKVVVNLTWICAVMNNTCLYYLYVLACFVLEMRHTTRHFLVLKLWMSARSST